MHSQLRPVVPAACAAAQSVELSFWPCGRYL